jgi:hypothetical protein
MENVSPRWNPVSRSDQADVLWNTKPYHGWSQPWESFSKGSQWFFATGFESYSSIGIQKNISLILRLMVFKKLTSINKRYGESEIPEGERSYRFIQTHQRRTHTDETWITGSFGVNWRIGPFDLWATLQFPLAYLLNTSTELEDRQQVLFDHTIHNTWQVQQPAAAQIFLIYSL